VSNGESLSTRVINVRVPGSSAISGDDGDKHRKLE
jgi:hypothetical protein